MQKAAPAKDEMRAHYDFRGGVRGRYASRYAEGTNVVVLDPDVARMFPDRESVNEALRAVGRVVQMRERRRARPNKGAPRDRGPALLVLSPRVTSWPRRVSAGVRLEASTQGDENHETTHPYNSVHVGVPNRMLDAPRAT